MRVPYAVALAVAGCAAAFAAILYLCRHLLFYYDEWDVIVSAPHPSLQWLLTPHNEHWSTVLYLVYEALLNTIGLRSYLPYMAVVLALHATAAFLLFLLVRSRAGDVPGLAAAAMLLFLGHGAENILWAFQIAWVGAVVLGLGALLTATRPGWTGLAAASGLALLGLMSAGVGLFFLAALGVLLLVERGWRAAAAGVALPVVVYAIWFLTFGRHGLAGDRSSLTLTTLLGLRVWVPYGIGTAVAGLLGLSSASAPLGLAVLALAAGLRWRALRTGWALAAIAGLLAEYVINGAVRNQFGLEVAASQRYVYIAAVFLLVLAGELVRDLPWHRVGASVVLAAVVLTVGANALYLRGQARDWTARAAQQRAELQALDLFGSSPALDPSRPVEPVLVPFPIRAYRAAVKDYGSPVPRATSPTTIGAGPLDAWLERVLAPESRIDDRGECGTCLPDMPSRLVDVPAGGTVDFASTSSLPIRVYVWYAGAPPSKATLESPGAAGRSYRVTLPATDPAITWHVLIQRPCC